MFQKLIKKMVGGRFDIVPPQLAIKAMRANGFKSTDYAIAELIDNSIQSGIEAGNKCTEVEIICVEEPKQIGQRKTIRISEIAVYDNAAGMDSETLRYAMMFGVGSRLSEDDQKGIGKFGMGLPNASISQCRQVDVYSWKDGKTFHTYLNVDEIMNGEISEIPEPKITNIPDHWKSLIKSKISDSGTLIIWSQLDRTSWVRHKAFFNHAEFLIGRMYRYFINNGTAKVRLAAYSRSGGKSFKLDIDTYVRPNDPLMLMPGTMAPPPYDKEAAFMEFGEPDKIVVLMPDDKESTITIRYSLANEQTRNTESGKAAGSADIGKYVAKNLGVSIIRAERELELNLSWNNPSEPRERWWGIEISFEPELDDHLGVTNDKQSATKLFRCDLSEDAKNEGITKSELIDNLTEAMDPRWVNYQVSSAIANRLTTIRKHIVKQREGALAGARGSSKDNDAESFASKATRRRIDKTGQKTSSDISHDAASDEDKQTAIKNQLIESGVSPETANTIAVESVYRRIRYYFTHTKLSSPSIFDIEEEMGEFFIKLNTAHPAHEHFIDLLRTDEDKDDSSALKGLKLLLTAWARMEAEASETELETLQDIRINWGRITRDFIREATDKVDE